MLQRIKDLTPGRSITWKPFLITYEVYRADENTFELSHTASGWHSVTLTLDELESVLDGNIKLSNLNWE